MSVVADLGYHWLQRHPTAVPMLAGVLQRISPILRAGRTFLVMRDADVREVLERRDDFELGELNGPKMLDALGADFLLGMDPSPRYDEDKNRLRKALRQLMPRFPDIVEEECESAAAALVPSAAGAGTRHWIDVVSHYAERITTRVAARFYGVPFDGATSRILRGSSEDVLRLWLRKLAAVIASPWPAPFGLRRIGVRCRQELCAHFDRHLAGRESGLGSGGGTQGVDLLTRLLEEGFASGGTKGRDFVRRNVLGMMVTGSAVIAKSFTHILDQLLQRPEFFEMAVKAATTKDGRTLRALALEAMRFNPTFLILPRYCPRETTLAARTPRRRTIPAGSTVYCVTLAAMFDAEAVLEPEAFRPGRDYAYLHFGTGLHWCLGQEIDVAMTQLEAMLRHLLALRCFAHADSRRLRRRRIVYDGLAVDRLWIRVPR
jgi:cytochrome P450